MFFKNIDSWSPKQLRVYWLIFNIAYLCATLLAPIIIVGCRYEIFKYTSKYKLTGWGLVLAIFIFIVGIKTLSRVLKKLPESTHKEQVVKYTILGVKALAVPIFALIIMKLFKSNFDLAYNTLWWCLLSYSIGITIDYTCIMYLDREIEIRKIAKEKIEIDKRVELLKQ